MEVHLAPEEVRAGLAGDVRSGLADRPRQLPPKWFYDERGCELFDAITRLPEYYLTRAERAILVARAGEVARLTGADTLVELGSGTSEKTRLLLDALADHGRLRRIVAFDVAESTIDQATTALATEYPGADVVGVVGDFHLHLGLLPAEGRRLVAFLGSTIGNLEPLARKEFLAELSAGMNPGDSLLLGTDLVKPPDRLRAAYDDAAGVTAAFNTNVLAVINRELGGDFDLDQFDHVARWDPDRAWMQMSVRSRCAQKVTVPGAGLSIELAAGEEIDTEISAKFTRSVVEAELAAAGFTLIRWWTDPAGDFAVSLSSVSPVSAT
ncbi:MAG: L-histidine N(alpha)-methyltransferase [Acidimicrobiales bacterium]